MKNTVTLVTTTILTLGLWVTALFTPFFAAAYTDNSDEPFLHDEYTLSGTIDERDSIFCEQQDALSTDIVLAWNSPAEDELHIIASTSLPLAATTTLSYTFAGSYNDLSDIYLACFYGDTSSWSFPWTFKKVIVYTQSQGYDIQTTEPGVVANFNENAVYGQNLFEAQTSSESTSTATSTAEEVTAISSLGALGLISFIGGFALTSWTWKHFLA